MSNVKYTACFIVLLFFLATKISWAQKNDCEQTLTNALEEFNAGHFYRLPVDLKPCIDNGFTREQRQRAYLLLTQTYLLIDDPIAAEDSYMKLLHANPEFVTDEGRDPVDVIYLSKKFTSAPIFSLFGRIGVNGSIARVIHDIDLYDGTDGKDLKEKYIIRPGFQINLGADWHLSEKISFSGGLQYMIMSYGHRTMGIYGRDVLDFQDKLNWLTIPLSIKYSSNKGNFKPFTYVGYSTNFLIGNRATIKYENNSVDINNSESTTRDTSPIVKLSYKRNIINNSFFIGGGVKRKVGLDYWFADLRYAFGLRNIVDTKNHYANNTDSDKYSNSLTPMMLYGQIEDYFRLDNLSISIGYIHPLYKPRKLKDSRIKSVFKKLRK